MSSTTFGATIVRSATPDTRTNLLADPCTDSPALTPAVSRDGAHPDQRPSSNLSPFYQLPSATHSRAGSERIKDRIAVFEKDVETGNVTPLSPTDEENPFGRNVAVETNKEDEMWPSRKTLKDKRKADKRQRRDRKGCVMLAPLKNTWSGYSKKQRLWIKIAIALFLVGVAVALGVGISVAVKGTYYSSDGNSKNIGSS